MTHPPAPPCLPLVELLKNLSVLRTTLVKSCDLHGSERSIREHAPSADWIAEVRTLFLRHNDQATEILGCADLIDPMTVRRDEASRAKALDFCLELRNADCSAIIRDLGTAVILAAQEYALLYSTALALEDYELAGLQLAQLEETTPLVMNMNRVLAEAAIADLGETYHVPHARATLRLAGQSLGKAWRSHDQAGRTAPGPSGKLPWTPLRGARA